MRSTRTIPLVAAVAALVFVFTAAPVSAATKAPVKLGQKVTIKGSKDVSSKSSATVEVELDDFYFNPTFIKAKAGEKITFKVENEGRHRPHVHVRRSVGRQAGWHPGKSSKFTVTVPSDGAVFQFHCDFHECAWAWSARCTPRPAPARPRPRLRPRPTARRAPGLRLLSLGGY